MIKKLFLLKLLIFQIIFISCQKHQIKWVKEDYTKYNHNTFKKIDQIYDTINTENINYKLLNAAIFYLTNKQRVKYKRKPFIYSASLEKAAQEHSQDMVKYNFYSHTSKVKGKKTMSNRLNLVGISNAYMAENINNFPTLNPTYFNVAKGLVDGWMNSKGHKANILNKEYVYLGCGTFYYYDSKWPNYFNLKSTQNFSSKMGE
ncbi:MAG: CAP domain-containing protein [Flavobacteriales bacterium]|nr:CAP domain-containing protein [Flavobacteriales bacterium]MDG1439677.1 CAP domain-containing protein [Flavobacteriales bacterium]MDG1797308.1 CAP domain-containing protein [Flavobacteriales bacterium]